MYKTVVFDLDGTLLNTLEDLTDAVLYIQKKFDFPLHNIELVRQHVGNGIRKLIIRSIPDGEDNPRFEGLSGVSGLLSEELSGKNQSL